MRKLSSAFSRRLTEEQKILIKSGYLNEGFERTKLGVQLFLNMLEAKYSEELLQFLKDKVETDEAKERAKASSEATPELGDEEDE